MLLLFTYLPIKLPYEIDMFAYYGAINTIKENLDCFTDFCQDNALIENTKNSEAQETMNMLHGTEFWGYTINVDFTFVGW